MRTEEELLQNTGRCDYDISFHCYGGSCSISCFCSLSCTCCLVLVRNSLTKFLVGTSPQKKSEQTEFSFRVRASIVERKLSRIVKEIGLKLIEG